MEQQKKHPLSEVLEVSLQNLRTLVDANTIIGEPVVVKDITIIPISRVSFGFGTGGAELPVSKPATPFGGGSGGGVTISPMAFLVVQDGKVQLMQLQTADNTADRIVNMMPGVVDKVGGIVEGFAAKRAEESAQGTL